MIGMSLLSPQLTTTINMAGTAAEAAASSAARGQRIKCNRGLGWMTLRECVERFQAGQEEADKEKNKCARDLGCASGRERAKIFQEDKTMANYGTCVECNRKGNRDSANRCNNAVCKKARGKKPEPATEDVPAPTPAPADGLDLVDDLTPKESPILDVIPQNGQHFQRYPKSVLDALADEDAQDEAAASTSHDVTCHDPAAEAAALDAVARLDAPTPAVGRIHDESVRMVTVGGVLNDGGLGTSNHFVEPTKMVTDFTRPFSFAGFEFDPGTPPPPPGRPVVRLAPSGTLSISSAATHAHSLTRFNFIRIIPDKSGSALALIFLVGKVDGARKLGPERKSGTSLKASAEAVTRVAPGLVGKPLELRPMGQDGAFVAVAVEGPGEAAA